ncbi:AraC family transcriptional regulator [Myxococcus stipitatus]|uniref:AraC family transcriptional regulator n=1 Tax=Myxococcus stipitatus TaxID=83455 RepID=UPI001F40E049|nr:AraC family transcriptional regulator [Myxococcus stipitatus]MCE9673217.1 AraC family transcriptional regulator [Myxococcus stipitatus]
MGELASRHERALGRDGHISPLPGLHLIRASAPGKPVPATFEPMLYVVVQGRKQVTLARERYVYDPANYLLTSVPFPATSKLLDASKEHPYLCIGISLDPALVSSVFMELSAEGDTARLEPRSTPRAVAVGPVDLGLLDAVLRLVRLVDSPRDARLLAPLIHRELTYRLLVGEQGARLAALALRGGHTHRVARAITWLREHFDEPIRVESMARSVGMSASGFHHHFRAVTGASPLQFQKQLRLQRARHLMLNESLDASTAAFRVGYNDASQFSREYRRLFGAPPLRDVTRLRGLP